MSRKKLISRPPIIASSFQHLLPSRFDTILLFSSPTSPNYRYHLSVIDDSSPSFHGTAVFLIPAGRESEYLFRTASGLRNIMESAKCQRLIAVSFHRKERYNITQKECQEELGPIVRQLRFEDDGDDNIPFMALDHGGDVGKRNIVAEGDSPSTGPYIVEEVQADEKRLRRLYFLKNEFVIQTEVCIKGEEVDKLYLGFDYHKHLCAGLVVLALHDIERCKGLVVGLGGGALVNFLHCFVPNMDITAVELDSDILSIAETHFAFREDENLRVILGDGLTIRPLLDEQQPEQECIPFSQSSFNLIAIDVDSKDPTCGMSCPPVPFIEIPYLTHLKDLLCEENAVLAINVSARDANMLQLVKTNVSQLFSYTYVSETDDINVVVFATKHFVDLKENKMEWMERIQSFFDRGPLKHVTELRSEIEQCAIGIVPIEADKEAPKSKSDSGKKKKKGKKKKGKR